MARTLKSVANFAAEKGFTEPQVRWWLARRNDNGFAKAGAAVQVGRRVLICLEGFERWLDGQQPNQDQAA